MLGHHRFAANSVPYQKSKSWTSLPKHHADPCADPGIFVRGGGGGGAGHLTKKSSDVFCFFIVHSRFNSRQMVNLKEIYHFSRFQRGSNIFQGGWGGGGGVVSNCLFPIETHITCDFPGGSGPPAPPPPLWILTARPKRFFLF